MSDSDVGEGTSVIKKRKYDQHFKEEWRSEESFKGWLVGSDKGSKYGKCKACNKDINVASGKDALIKHSLGQFHLKKCKASTSQPAITSYIKNATTSKSKLEKDIKEGEIVLSAMVAEHNLPFTIMDHLIKVIGRVCHDSEVAKGLACGRTKTSAIVKNVLGSHSFETLCDFLKKNKFSLIIDESTDLTTKKHLCLVARRVVNCEVKDDFLTLIEVTDATALKLYENIKHFFIKNDIPYKQNLIGFASDGANVMMGKHNSVMTLLKNDIPSLYHIKCICHSFHLCASYASQKIPRFVEDVTRDIYNYFSSSPKRTAELSLFQAFCNVKIHKILHPCQTRWLSVHSVIGRILEQYNALQLYFTDAVSRNDVLASENILRKLNDPTTKLFLLFLDFTLPFFTTLNKEMQAETPKLHLIYKNISNVLRTIFDCFIKREYLQITAIEDVDFKNPHYHINIENIYYGANVGKFISDGNFPTDKLNFFRLRALEFYIEACSQILQRFPLKNNPLKNFEFLDPAVVKSGNIPSILNVAIIFPNLVSEKNLQTIDTEWRLLRNIKEIESFPTDMLCFWQEVRRMESGDGTLMFNVLTGFVFDLLCLPHSSANVERIFSAINLMKTKQRNKLSTETISGLLHTKSYIGRNDSCYDIQVTAEHFAKLSDKKILYESRDIS